MDQRLADLLGEGLSGAEVAKIFQLSEHAVRYRAAKLDLPFDSSARSDLVRFVAKGGALVKEDLGGSIGVRWARAHRSGPPFSTDSCERLLILGLIQQVDPARSIFSMGGAIR